MKDDFLIIDGSFGKWIDYENNRYKLAENICFRDPGEDSVPVEPFAQIYWETPGEYAKVSWWLPDQAALNAWIQEADFSKNIQGILITYDD